MADRLTPAQRSACMKSNKSKDTGPEMLVRRALFGAGYRYRLHSKTVIGKPDIVIHGRKLAVFIDGDFWHGREWGTLEKKLPNDFWKKKIARNIERDKEVNAVLAAKQWTVVRIWEHDVKRDLAGSVERIIKAISI